MNLKNALDQVKSFAGQSGFSSAPRPPEVVAGEIIQGALLLVGVVFGILIIYAGYLWMIARGNEEDVKKSLDILKNAVIGFIIVSAAYAISDYVVSQVIQSAYTP